MDKEIKDNIKKIKVDEEKRFKPEGSGFNFDKENENIKRLKKEREIERYNKLSEKRDNIFKVFVGTLLAYFIIFTSFTSYSMFNIQKGLDAGNRNERINELEKKTVLATKEVNGIRLDIYKVEFIDNGYKIDYAILNESKNDTGVMFNEVVLVREDDKVFTPGMQFTTMKKDTLAPGDATSGFITFFEAEGTGKVTETNKDATKDGYYELDEKGELVYREGKSPAEESEETEKEEESEDKKEEDDTSKKLEGLNIKISIPFIDKSGVNEILLEIVR